VLGPLVDRGVSATPLHRRLPSIRKRYGAALDGASGFFGLINQLSANLAGDDIDLLVQLILSLSFDQVYLLTLGGPAIISRGRPPIPVPAGFPEKMGRAYG